MNFKRRENSPLYGNEAMVSLSEKKVTKSICGRLVCCIRGHYFKFPNTAPPKLPFYGNLLFSLYCPK